MEGVAGHETDLCGVEQRARSLRELRRKVEGAYHRLCPLAVNQPSRGGLAPGGCRGECRQHFVGWQTAWPGSLRRVVAGADYLEGGDDWHVGLGFAADRDPRPVEDFGLPLLGVRGFSLPHRYDHFVILEDGYPHCGVVWGTRFPQPLPLPGL